MILLHQVGHMKFEIQQEFLDVVVRGLDEKICAENEIKPLIQTTNKQ